MDEQLDGLEKPVKKLVENTYTIAFARLFMPVALAIIGYFMVTTLADIKTSNNQIWAYLNKLSDTLHQQQIDLAKVKVKVDDTQYTINQLQSQIGDLQRQVRSHP